MNTLELVKQAVSQNVHGVVAFKKYLQKVSKEINSTKMTDICDGIYNNYLAAKKDNTQFNELSVFLNLQIEKAKGL